MGGGGGGGGGGGAYCRCALEAFHIINEVKLHISS